MTHGALSIDREQIASFVDTLFRYADEQTFASLRGFDQNRRNIGAFLIRGVKLNGSPRTDLIKQAIEAANICANHVDPVVFAPPIATFTNPERARLSDLANGLALSIDIDDVDPEGARLRLETILGPATLIIASGSSWVDEASGELKPKLHLHWRLSEPTRTAAEHDKLLHARTAATTLIGGDPTGKPIIHPLRWPGSWNRKGTPVLAHIVAIDAAREIHLDEAVDVLSEAAGALYVVPVARSGEPVVADATLIREAFSHIPNVGREVHYDQWIKFGYAAYRALADDGLVVWDEWSKKSGKYDRQETYDAWLRIAHAVVGTTATRQISAGTIFFEAAKNGWERPEELPELLRRGMAEHQRRLDAGEVPPFADWDQAPAKEVLEFPATPFSPADLLTIQPRQWVYGHFIIRRFISVLGAPGGTGKTAYAMAIGVSVALNQSLLGETVHQHGAVWIYNLEDPQDEILRRLSAIVQYHKIDSNDLFGHLYLDSGRNRPLVMAAFQDGALVTSPIVQPMVAELKARKVKLLIVDPFVKSHRLEENRNDHIDFAATLWSEVADQADCAILLVHHFRKGGLSGDADAFRGASALIDASRAAVSLSIMSEQEADRLGIEPQQRRFHIRADNAKLNLAPPPTEALWLRLQSVELSNGDKVQTVAKFDPPSPWNGLGWNTISNVIQIIGRGPGGHELYAAGRQSKDRWAGNVLMQEAGKSPAQAVSILKEWIANGVLEECQYASPARKGGMSSGLAVNASKLAEMTQSWQKPMSDETA